MICVGGGGCFDAFEIDDGIWSIYYYDVLIARFDERAGEVIS